METIELQNDLIEKTYNLCVELKSLDEHPCSYWGYDKETLSEAISAPNIKTVVCRNSEEQIIGIGTLTKGGVFQDHWAEIGVAVHPYQRKNGIAKEIVQTLENYKDDLNIEFIKALILENNLSSRKFFEKLNYIHKATLFHDFKIEGFGNLNDCAYYKLLS